MSDNRLYPSEDELEQMLREQNQNARVVGEINREYRQAEAPKAAPEKAGDWRDMVPQDNKAPSYEPDFSMLTPRGSLRHMKALGFERVPRDRD